MEMPGPVPAGCFRYGVRRVRHPLGYLVPIPNGKSNPVAKLGGNARENT
jgi:hypothetical protein